jgi:hypothetical protein
MNPLELAAHNKKEAASELLAELKKAGRSNYLNRVSTVAQKGLQHPSTNTALQKLKPETRQLVTQMDALIAEGTTSSEWSDEKITQFAREVAWAKAAATHAATMVFLQNEGGGPTPATACANEYDQCMKENHCEPSFFCLCCVPCSLQYMGCLRKIILGETGVITPA